MNPTFEELLADNPGPFQHDCEICGKSYETNDRWQIPRVCGDACGVIYQKRQAEEDERRIAQAIADRRSEAAEIVRRSSPPRLANTDICHAGFNRQVWAVISQWQPTDAKPWLGLLGSTGTCKTRMAIMKAVEIFQAMSEKRRASFEFISAYELARLALTQYSDSADEKHKATQRLDRLDRASLLLVDDLDKTRFTPAITETVFAMFDRRHGQGSPTLWTANSTAEHIGSLMASEFGPAFAGRLVDCSTTYLLK